VFQVRRAASDEPEEGVGIIAAVGDNMAALFKPAGKSGAWPAVSTRPIGGPFSSTSALMLVLSPPRERLMA
jgi:hypothetical protein